MILAHGQDKNDWIIGFGTADTTLLWRFHRLSQDFLAKDRRVVVIVSVVSVHAILRI